MAVMNVHDVAAYIVSRNPGIEALSLQKMLYYAQGIFLGMYGDVLFDAELQAWKYGPVVPEVRANHRWEDRVFGYPSGDASSLDSKARAVVDAVLDSFGHLGGWVLAEMTHLEPPWVQTRAGLSAEAKSQRPIKKELMREFFGEVTEGASDSAKAAELTRTHTEGLAIMDKLTSRHRDALASLVD